MIENALEIAQELRDDYELPQQIDTKKYLLELEKFTVDVTADAFPTITVTYFVMKKSGKD